MAALLISIFLLTVIDAICSAWEIRMGWMREANVLIRDAVMSHPELTCAVIALAVGLVLLGLWRVRHKIKWLPKVMYGVMIIKAGIAVYHFVGISQAIFQW